MPAHVERHPTTRDDTWDRVLPTFSSGGAGSLLSRSVASAQLHRDDRYGYTRRLNRPRRDPMDHADTLRRFYDLINAGDVDGFGDLLADDFVEHEEAPGLAPTKHGAEEFFRMYIAAFPNLRFDAEDVLASGDKVVARVRVTGTHEGEFMGLPATGKNLADQAIDIVRFGDDGLAHEHWGVFDAMAMMQQLGVMPEGAPD